MEMNGLRKPLEQFARTKIVATIGPACRNIATLESLIQEGVSIFRLNMAHGDQKVHGEAMDMIYQASANIGIPVAVLVDLAGPKIRLWARSSTARWRRRGIGVRSPGPPALARGSRPRRRTARPCRRRSSVRR